MNVKLEDNYFSDPLKWTVVSGSVLISGYLLITSNSLPVIFILVIISLMMFSTRYVMEVDTNRKLILDSFYFLWIRTRSEQFKFNALNCIRLDKERITYRANSRIRDRQADFHEYIGTLEYDQGKSVELKRNVEYESVASDMKHMAAQLNIPIDRTF